MQLAILRMYVADGDRQAGWKVGLTSNAMRAQQGIAEPCMGFLLASGHLRSGIRLKFDDLTAPAFENELCLTVGETLRGPGVTYAMARGAIATVEPALEIAEVRGDFSADMSLSIADNAQQKAFVTGAPTAFGADTALEQARVEVTINGRQRAHAMGAEVMGDPVHSVVWLANKLAEYGVALEAGKRIMSGSFTQQFSARKGDAVLSRFTPFGVVEVAFD